MAARYTTVSVRPSTLERVRQLKRGGESYDELLRQMADAYEPDR